MNKILLSAALAGILSARIAVSASAADDTGKEKCYGISETGKNDCRSSSGSHACAGQSTKDNDPTDWKLVNKGDCAKKGGSLEGAR